MKNKIEEIPFGKAFLTSLFLGIIATMICLGFNIWYRLVTFYGPSDIINVSSIIFIVNILLLLAGVAYYAIKSWSEKGDWIYAAFFMIFLAFCLWKTIGIHRFTNLKLNHEFVQLLGGTVFIIGIAVLLVPYFYNSKKISELFYEADV